MGLEPERSTLTFFFGLKVHFHPKSMIPLRENGGFAAERSEATKVPSEARLIKYISTNPPKGLCKADTEGGSIGGEAAGRAKRG